LQVLP